MSRETLFVSFANDECRVTGIHSNLRRYRSFNCTPSIEYPHTPFSNTQSSSLGPHPYAQMAVPGTSRSTPYLLVGFEWAAT